MFYYYYIYLLCWLNGTQFENIEYYVTFIILDNKCNILSDYTS